MPLLEIHSLTRLFPTQVGAFAFNTLEHMEQVINIRSVVTSDGIIKLHLKYGTQTLVVPLSKDDIKNIHSQAEICLNATI